MVKDMRLNLFFLFGFFLCGGSLMAQQKSPSQ